MTKVVQTSLAISVLMVALSVAYYFLEFLPNKEAYRKAEAKRVEESRIYCNQWSLDKALAGGVTYDQEVYDDYFSRCLREKGISSN